MNYAGLLTEMSLTHFVNLNSMLHGVWICSLQRIADELEVISVEANSPEAAVRKAYLVLNGRNIPVLPPSNPPRFK